MKHSIRKQFAFIFIGLMTGTILLCWFINGMFLEKYYIESKKKIIKNAHAAIAQAAGSDNYGTEEFVDELNSICSVSNIAVCVMDGNSQAKYESANGGMELEILLLNYIFELNEFPTKVIEEQPDYILQRALVDRKEYLLMFGQLDSGISFVIRTPIESIRESAGIANQFFAYAGVVGTLIGALLIWLVTGKMIKPIKTLNHISEQMVELNFDVKYQGTESNEIGMLGQNMNKLSESLEHAISELKTVNNELRKDIAAKKQIDEMRKEFLANVSHELKTPIALIKGYAEGLVEGISDDPESRAYYCSVIADEAEKMNRMVQKLMTLNQLEFGMDVINMERFDIAELIKNCIQTLEVLLDKSEIEITCNIPDSVYVWGDVFKTEEVVRNYLTNAINHCEGDHKIVIGIQEKDSDYRITVFNTGRPIPEDSMPRIWDKFYKVDKARTREYGGSGVGLSIVKAIMEAMHKGYGAENYSNGVMFWFELEKCSVNKAN